MKFRKKPVVIEAVQYTGNDGDNPAANQLCYCSAYPAEKAPHIHTLEGVMYVSAGDWIITGVKGERYPCKPDIFEATYERVDDSSEGK
jgi:hypothetical protein